uniref:Uncharacterized protein n=1 Tax=Rhizophora mucronata TaxID=61149 RepID=A0A2P2QF26_RHIMU
MRKSTMRRPSQNLPVGVLK